MVLRFLRRGHSLDRFLPGRWVISSSPSFMSSSSSSRGSSSGRGSKEEEEEEVVAAPRPPLEKRVLSRSHGSRATPGRHFDLPSKTARDGGMPSAMDLMKEKFAKLLLGEDMSGTGKGVSSALASPMPSQILQPGQTILCNGKNEKISRTEARIPMARS